MKFFNFVFHDFQSTAKDIPRCKIGDTDCIIEVSNQLMPAFAKGHNGINLIPLDPMQINEIQLKQGRTSPVNINLIFKDVQLIGLAQHKFYKIRYKCTRCTEQPKRLI